jgi:cobalt/nickel transport system permease protein
MSEQSFIQAGHRHRRGHFLERVASGFVQAMDHERDAEAVAAGGGVLQRLDPRFKLAALLVLIVSVVLATTLAALAALFLLAVALALASHVTLGRLLKQVWIGVLFFTGVIALPSIVLVPGDPVYEIPLLHWTVTLQGLRSAAFLVGRAETAASFALLLILTTPWPHVLKALRAIKVPVARLVGKMTAAERRRIISGGAGALLGKAVALSNEVYLAMLSRGYHGEVYLLDDFRSGPRDWAVLAIALAVPGIILWAQR